jgi:Na+-driven multidrug efflux pump
MTIWAAVMLFPRGFASIFTSEPALLDFTASALRIYCAVLGIFGIQIACQMTFVSLGKALSSMVVAIMRKFVLLLPLIYIVPAFFDSGMKTTGVYLAEPIADVIAVSFTAVLFAIQFKKVMASIDGKEICPD